MPQRRGVVLDRPASVGNRTEWQRRVEEDGELLLDGELDDTRVVCRKEQEERVRAWQLMRLRLRFIETYKKRDFNQIWLDLCQDDPEAKAAIRSYLRDYVEISQTTGPVLGEQEFEYVQTITSTTTVITHWRILVAYADNMILRPMRRDDPAADETRRPRQLVEVEVEWIRKDLAARFSLIRESELTFEKVETTADDVLMLLDTLWTRAEDVPCKPQYRIALHWTLILAGLGFRPGSLMRFCSKHVRLSVIRDLNNGRTTLAATINVTHDKRHKADPRRQEPEYVNSTVGFTVFFVPCQLLCLVSLIATQAIADHKMLNRPNLEHTDALELHWRKDIMEREIFPSSYNK
ncbi:hypothetical protein N658DRAFT_487380 [Parathielavia hyrcaniae]|uniref:Uncharacterized protein n=1 Tax=Parathielavia hyrcaniae TaxID=113614 RepID=A0AAN6SZR6_9PEZI|nr:hypothetical protein N658DRAFT_487380 [Parathielavia hyrcaniae]